MSYVKFHAVHYDKSSETEWTSTGSLVDAFDVKVKTAIGDKRNTFEFKVLNNNDEFSRFFEPNDKVEIYLTIDADSYTSNDILMVGVIKEVGKTLDNNKEVLHIKGIDYSEAVLSGLVFLDGSGQNSMEILQLLVNSLNNKNQATSTSKRYNLTLNAPSLKFNDATGAYDGSAFPDINSAREFYKTGIKVIEKYLSSDFTEDGRYYWYVNTDNELYVRKRTQVVDQTGGADITITEGQDCYNVDIGQDIKGVKNFVVWKAGQDPSNKTIMGVKDNPISRVKHGFKPHFLLTHDTVAQPLFDNEQNSAAAGTFEVSSKMIVSSAYPYTTNWTSTATDSDNSPNTTAGSTVTVADDTEWVYAFRREVKWQSEKEAQRILDEFANGYLKVVCDLPHSATYQVGQLIKFNSPRYGLTNKSLRIQEVNYDINGLTLSLIEDIPTI